MRLLIFSIFFCSFNFIWAQSLKLDYLFSPGASFGAENTFNANINDSVDYRVSKWRAQLVIPLKSKASANLNMEELKKLNFKKSITLKAKQDFLTINYSQRQPRTELFSDNQNVHTFALGYTSLRANIKQGIWLYSANLYFSESTESFKSVIQPNLLAYAVKAKIKNLKFIYFYGAAFVYNQKKPIPVPLMGFTAKLNSNMRLTAILPVQINLNYKVNKTFNMDFSSTMSGFNAVYRNSIAETLNDSHLKTYIAFNKRLDKGLNASFETGYALFRNLNYINTVSEKENFAVSPAPYLSLNLKYKLGAGLLQSKIEGVD